jgi:hypothetical protein
MGTRLRLSKLGTLKAIFESSYLLAALDWAHVT